MELKIYLIGRLGSRMKEAGIDLPSLAQAARIEQPTLRTVLERGKCRTDTLEKIADALGLEVVLLEKSRPQGTDVTVVANLETL